MQFSCYNCGLVFSKGLPPMEALSTAQAQAVGSTEVVDRDVLVGTPFEGMSPYNFCGFCISAIRDFPSAIKHPAHEFRHGTRKPGAEQPHYCTCGFVYEGCPNYPQDHSYWWIWANRMRLLHAAKDIYTNGDFTLLEELITQEV